MWMRKINTAEECGSVANKVCLAMLVLGLGEISFVQMREQIAYRSMILSQYISERWFQINNLSRPSASLERISRQPAHFLNSNAGVDNTKRFKKVSNSSPYQFISLFIEFWIKTQFVMLFVEKKCWKWLLKRNRRGLSEHMICRMASEMRFVDVQVKDNPIKCLCVFQVQYK